MKRRRPHTLRIGIGHLFATGANPSRDALFHVACTCYTTEAPPEPRQWILNPGRTITRRLYQKSRLSTAVCSEAPGWADLGPHTITPFFADLDILLIYNLENERAWFQEIVLDAVKTPPICVDLFEMAQFFLPDRALHHADALLDQTLGVGGWQRAEPRLPSLIRGYRAVLQDILTAIRAAPYGYALLKQAVSPSNTPIAFSVIYELARQATQIKWTTDLFAHSFPQPTTGAAAIDSARALTQEVQVFLPTSAPVNPRREAPRPAPTPITPAHIDQGFETLAVTTNRQIQPRPAQREYARACAQALNRGGVFALEAGTGTGKTLGYLLPLCERLRQTRGQVVIATATKNLQDQILEQEIPRLTSGKTLYQDLTAAVLKGKANYLCITALTDLYEDVYLKEKHNAADRLAWLYLYMVLVRKQGEIEGVPRILKQRFPILADFIEEVNAQMACMPGLCRVGNDCIYPRRLREAGAADIVITNQHKLASMDASIVLNTVACLIDEADQFPENFRSATQKQLSVYDLRRRFLRRLVGSRKRRGYAEILEERFRNDGAYAEASEEHDTLDMCLDAIQSVRAECEQVEASLRHLGTVPEGYHEGEVRWQNMKPLDAGEQVQDGLKHLAHQFERIGAALGRILSSGRYRLSRQPAETKKARVLQKERTRLEKYQNLARDLMREARDIAADYPSADFVHVFEKKGSAWTLSKLAYDIKEALDLTLFRPISTVLFTSASLFVHRRLDLFARELFLEEPFTDTLRVRSSFDYEGKVFGAVTTFIPRFAFTASPLVKEQWRNNVARTIAALAVATYGRTLVLFTNAREMKAIYNTVSPILQAHDIDPIVQDGSSLAEIQAFRLTEHSALFGVNRFWTGVDFPGPTLSQVIVVRLPNPSLGNPLIQHRREQMGEAFWEQYYRPLTSLRLKQGFGRLIRSEKDRGIFVVLDQRLVTDTRMQSLKEVLPIALHPISQEWNRTHQRDLQDLITQGLKTLGLHQEFIERGIDVYALKEAL